jgi:hypothetical protein
MSKTKEHHQLILYLKRMLSNKQCKRYHQYVCCQKYINNNATHYWEKKYTIKKFIEEYTNEYNHWSMWLIRENAGNFIKVCDYLENKDCGSDFPDLERNMGVYAFKNGLYNCRHIDANGILTWKFYTYGSEEVIPGHLVASKFFDLNFTANQYTKPGTVDNWRDIPTKYFDKLAKYQFEIYKKHSGDIYDFLSVLIGRLPAELNKYDSWSVFPYIVGLAGCGKSMIIENVIGYMFEDIDIGWLENDNERKFGWSPFKNKKIILSTEIERSFNTPETLFKKLISGENVTLAVKGESPVEMQWVAPIVFSGNELFGLNDKAGSIARRTITFRISRPVNEKDKITNMNVLLRNNVGNLIHKFTCAYLEKRKIVGTNSIWNNLPQYFIDQRELVNRRTNPFYEYVLSNEIELGQDFYVELHEFKMAYRLYCKYNGHKIDSGFSQDTYEGPFANIGLKYHIDIKVEHGVVKNYKDIDGNVGPGKPNDYVTGLKISGN